MLPGSLATSWGLYQPGKPFLEPWLLLIGHESSSCPHTPNQTMKNGPRTERFQLYHFLMDIWYVRPFGDEGSYNCERLSLGLSLWSPSIYFWITPLTFHDPIVECPADPEAIDFKLWDKPFPPNQHPLCFYLYTHFHIVFPYNMSSLLN